MAPPQAGVHFLAGKQARLSHDLLANGDARFREICSVRPCSGHSELIRSHSLQRLLLPWLVCSVAYSLLATLINEGTSPTHTQVLRLRSNGLVHGLFSVGRLDSDGVPQPLFEPRT